MPRLLSISLLILTTAACDDASIDSIGDGDAGRSTDSGASADGGADDAGVETDGGLLDAGADSDGGSTDAGSGTDGGPVDAGSAPTLALSALRCAHDPVGALVEGQLVQCWFDVTGTAGRSVNFRCEDTTGSPVGCDCTTETQIQPCHVPDRAIPFEALLFGQTDGLGGSDFSIVVIADDGVETARRRFDLPVGIDDGINVAPTIGPVDCAGDTDLDVEMTADGTVHECSTRFVDPDPIGGNWSISRTTGSVGHVSPVAGTTLTPVHDLGLRFWSSTPGTTTWTLTVNDSVAPPETRVLTVRFR